MTLTRYNATAATLTKNRTGGDWCPISGMCVTCVEGCTGMCEVGRSAYRGREVIYPQPFGIMTTAAQKDYPIDLSHFNIMGTAVGAVGIEEDPEDNPSIYTTGSTIRINAGPEWQGAELTVMNLMGQVIYEGSFKQSADININTGQEAGLFIVSMATDTKVFSRKIILQ